MGDGVLVGGGKVGVQRGNERHTWEVTVKGPNLMALDIEEGGMSVCLSSELMCYSWV